MSVVELPTDLTEAALVVRGVCAGYPETPSVLCGVTFTVRRGGCLAVVGPSGGGKTTLLRVIAGLVRPTRGGVSFPALERAAGNGRPTVGYIPQNLGLVRNRTVVENVLLGAVPRLGWWSTLTARFPRQERAAAEEALERVGMGGRSGVRVETLSGGERRRVAIARALLQHPALLLADEFRAEVDRVSGEAIVRLLGELRRASGMTMVFVDHDLEAACRIADRIAVLAGGRTVGELDAPEANARRLAELFAVASG